MKFRSNVHTHSDWCDGENTLEEMAAAAVKLGFTDLGFSSHSPAPFDPGCPGVSSEADYRRAVRALSGRFGKLRVLCGMEQDYYAPAERGMYDYIIHSTHYLPGENGAAGAAVGDAPEMIREAFRGRYHGDGIAMCRDYFMLVAKGVRQYKPDIVGHYEYILRHNQSERMFDEDGKGYRDAALGYLDEVIEVIGGYGGMAEVNTSAMQRGRANPYCAPFLLKRLAEKGARVIITSDSHRAGTLDFRFETALEMIRAAGFRSMAVLQDGAFRDVLTGK